MPAFPSQLLLFLALVVALLLHFRLQPYVLPAANHRESVMLLLLLVVSCFELARVSDPNSGMLGSSASVAVWPTACPACCRLNLICRCVPAAPMQYVFMDAVVTACCGAVFLWFMLQVLQVAVRFTRRVFMTRGPGLGAMA